MGAFESAVHHYDRTSGMVSKRRAGVPGVEDISAEMTQK